MTIAYLGSIGGGFLYEVMARPQNLAIILVIIPFLSQISKIIANPAQLVQAPTDEDTMDIVDTMAGQSIALFALILVIIQFIIGEEQLTNYDILGATTMVIAAIFVMLAFAVRVIAGLKMAFFNFQLTAVRYAGLALFLGMYFSILSRPFPESITKIFALFLLVTWGIWFTHELHFIFFTERSEWNDIDMNRREWAIEQFSNLKQKLVKKVP